jgi:hypothetical protein
MRHSRSLVSTRTKNVLLPDARFVHGYLARGRADLDGVGTLEAGDAVWLTAAGELRHQALLSAEVPVWEMDLDLRDLQLR